MTPEGDGVLGEDGWGRGRDGNSPTTQDTKGSGYSSSGEETASGPGPAAPQCPQRSTLEGGGSKVTMHRNPDGGRPEHGALARREYGLLVTNEPEGDPAAIVPWDREDSPKATMGTGFPDERATETGYHNGQRALLVCGHPEDADVDI